MRIAASTMHMRTSAIFLDSMPTFRAPSDIAVPHVLREFAITNAWLHPMKRLPALRTCQVVASLAFHTLPFDPTAAQIPCADTTYQLSTSFAAAEKRVGCVFLFY